MRLRTIIDPTYPMSLRERGNRLAEWMLTELVWKLPRRLIYWTIIRAAVVTAGNGNPSEVKSIEMLKQFDTSK